MNKSDNATTTPERKADAEAAGGHGQQEAAATGGGALADNNNNNNSRKIAARIPGEICTTMIGQRNRRISESTVAYRMYRVGEDGNQHPIQSIRRPRRKTMAEAELEARLLKKRNRRRTSVDHMGSRLVGSPHQNPINVKRGAKEDSFLRKVSLGIKHEVQAALDQLTLEDGALAALSTKKKESTTSLPVIK